MPLSPEAKRARARDLRLQRTYNITQEQYDAMLEAQDGRCAICQLPPRGKLPLNVDHDHKSGLVRGLLCWTCNHKLLPAARDTSERLRRAAQYLDTPPAEAVVGQVVAPAKPRKSRPSRSRAQAMDAKDAALIAALKEYPPYKAAVKKLNRTTVRTPKAK